jgi:PAS domain S-box-containing protein
VALLLSSWYAQVEIKTNLLNERAASLQTVLESTHQALLSWYKEQRASAMFWANNQRIKSLARQLLKLPHTPTALAHAPAQAELRTILGSVLKSRKYQGYFLLAGDGVSLASSRDDNIGTPNLLQDQPLFLRKVTSGQIALSQPQASDVPMPNFRGVKQTGLPTMFVGAPVYGDKGEVIAVFVFRINPLADFSAILQRGSIGDTGESFAFSHSGRLISNSRFEPELRARGLLRPGEYSMLNVWLRIPQNGPGKQQDYTGYPESWPMSLVARSGTRGLSGLSLDGFTGYYGKPVLSTWLWDDTLQFGIATEMGKDEAYKTINIIQYTVYVLTGFAIALLIFFAGYFYFSQRKLRESELQFSSIIDMSDEAIISIDTEERIIMANRAAERMFGYRADELLGQRLDWLLPDAIRQSHSGHIQAFLASAENLVARDARGHVQGRRKNGELFTMEASLTKQRVGGRTSLTFSGRDVTERLRSEQELRDSERMFRQVFDASEDAILILQDDSFVDCNEATVRMLHAPDKQAVLSQHPWELSPEYQPDGCLSEEKAGEMIRLAHENHFHRFEWMHRRLDGEDFPVEVTLTTTQIGGRPYLHVMWNDISERKQAELALRENEQLLSMLADYSSDMISVHDPEGVYRYASPICEKLLGYRPDELVGHSAYEFFHPDDLEAIRQSHHNIVETGTTNFVRYRIRRHDGNYIWVETASNTVCNDETGEIKEIVAVSRDITQRVEAEQNEEQLQRQLMHTQKMEALGRLTGGIAHDFNNILASAKGYTELAMMEAEGQQDEKQLHYLSEVYKSTDRAASVVKQLLAFARGSKAAPSHHLLQDVVEDTLTMMRPLLTSRIEIETHLDEEAVPVLVDNVQLNQVILNLCINARDAMEATGRITIGVRNARARGECSSCHAAIDFDAVELTIQDNGPGMEPEHMSRIFDPFYTSKEVGKGSGMGLSVVHGIVHDHHGHIQVESEPGQGTTFHIYLPVAD